MSDKPNAELAQQIRDYCRHRLNAPASLLPELDAVVDYYIELGKRYKVQELQQYVWDNLRLKYV